MDDKVWILKDTVLGAQEALRWLQSRPEDQELRWSDSVSGYRIISKDVSDGDRVSWKLGPDYYEYTLDPTQDPDWRHGFFWPPRVFSSAQLKAFKEKYYIEDYMKAFTRSGRYTVRSEYLGLLETAKRWPNAKQVWIGWQEVWKAVISGGKVELYKRQIWIRQ